MNTSSKPRQRIWAVDHLTRINKRSDAQEGGAPKRTTERSMSAFRPSRLLATNRWKQDYLFQQTRCTTLKCTWLIRYNLALRSYKHPLHHVENRSWISRILQNHSEWKQVWFWSLPSKVSTDLEIIDLDIRVKTRFFFLLLHINVSTVIKLHFEI